MSFNPGTNKVLVELSGRTAVITLNRPEARNALSPELSKGLSAAIAWAGQADEVGAVMLTGAGAAFCSGGDVKAMGKRSSGSNPAPSVEHQFRDLQQRHHAIGGALYKLRKPTIAVLPGPAAGAGLAIALACDMRIALDSTFLTTGYAGIGLSGDYGVAWLLTRVVGPARARQLMLTSERVSASDALQMGLVNQIATADELTQVATTQATALAQGPTVAYGYIKDNLDEAFAIDHATAIDREADRMLKTRSTHDHKAAVKAFAQKTKPEFLGK